MRDDTVSTELAIHVFRNGRTIRRVPQHSTEFLAQHKNAPYVRSSTVICQRVSAPKRHGIMQETWYNAGDMV